MPPRKWPPLFVRNALPMALRRHRLSSRRSSSSCSSNGVAVLLQYRSEKSPLLSQILRLYSCHLDQKEAGHSKECPASFFCLFTRFELATRGSKCEAFGRNSPGDCFAASALYLCADYAFLPVEQPECPASFFGLFARFELATRGSKCAAFGRNSPGDCFAASALYLCARLLLSAGGAALFLRRCSTYCSTWSCQV